MVILILILMFIMGLVLMEQAIKTQLNTIQVLVIKSFIAEALELIM